jgi:hypothetical protein
MRVLAVLVGVILLLPGLCSVGFIILFLPQIGGGHGIWDSPIVLLWLVCFAISYGGIVMIRNGIRGERPPRERGPTE